MKNIALLVKGFLLLNILSRVWAGSPPLCDALPKLASDTVISAHLHKDLAKYISGMNKSSLQKAVFAMLAKAGIVLDLGAGSGITSHDLAILMPFSKIIGVDLDPAMVKHANDNYQRANLEYRVGNAQKPNYADSSIDAVFMSSTTHHLTSYGEGSFDIKHVYEAFDQVVRILKDEGIFVLRDFVIPDGPEWIFLELPESDGVETGAVKDLSTAALFSKFAVDFRSSKHPTSGVEHTFLPSDNPGWKKIRVRLRDAAEFVLRKDYKDSYDAEIKEEYTFLTQKGFEEAFTKRGLRVLHSGPINNPWIVSNRYNGKFRISDEKGKDLAFPPTNYVIVGQKVRPNEAIQIREVSAERKVGPGYVKISTFRDKSDGKLVDITGRPFNVIDLIPYYDDEGGNTFVLAKEGFPRPITQSLGATENLSKVQSGGYRVEPLSFFATGEKPQFLEVEEALLNRAGLSRSTLLPGKVVRPLSFFSSPGNVDEKVTSQAIEIKPGDYHGVPLENYSGFSTSGDLRTFEAQSVLRGGQAGSILDARLELAVYNLLLERKKEVGPWIGDDIKLEDQKNIKHTRAKRAKTVLNNPKRERRFEPATREAGSESFLDVWKSKYEEVDVKGKTVSEGKREYVVPRKYSHNVVSTLPVYRTDGKVYVGLETKNLPAVQMHEGYSDVIVNPAFRLPRDIETTKQGTEFVYQQLEKFHRLKVKKSWELGGSYQSSIGVTPETVYPRVVEVEIPNSKELEWVELGSIIKNRELLKDGHLSIAVHRLAHALGYLEKKK